MIFRRLVALILLAGVLSSCAGQTADDPANAVRQYLTAKAAGDADGVRRGLCSALEADLERETLAFKDLNARLEDMECAADSAASTVTCSGQIVLDYGGEVQAFPLSTYTVVQENGAWKWCGEAP
jgi:hypothetical protein